MWGKKTARISGILIPCKKNRFVLVLLGFLLGGVPSSSHLENAEKNNKSV